MTKLSSLFSFKCRESVVLYIISLEVALELSRFCKMALRSKVVGPRWFRQNGAVEGFQMLMPALIKGWMAKYLSMQKFIVYF